jgi:hypothetical protein
MLLLLPAVSNSFVPKAILYDTKTKKLVLAHLNKKRSRLTNFILILPLILTPGVITGLNMSLKSFAPVSKKEEHMSYFLGDNYRVWIILISLAFVAIAYYFGTVRPKYVYFKKITDNKNEIKEVYTNAINERREIQSGLKKPLVALGAVLFIWGTWYAFINPKVDQSGAYVFFAFSVLIIGTTILLASFIPSYYIQHQIKVGKIKL